MNWFQRLKQRLQDMRTLKNLGLAAEEEAAGMNELPPGSEHFVLAAMKMNDGTVRAVFRKLAVNPDDFRGAIAQQYDDALRDVGIEPPVFEPASDQTETVTPKPALFQAKPDVSTLFENMKAHTDQHPDIPLLGAIVLIGVARLEYGVTARAFDAMGISRERLIGAAREVLSQYPEQA